MTQPLPSTFGGPSLKFENESLEQKAKKKVFGLFLGLWVGAYGKVLQIHRTAGRYGKSEGNRTNVRFFNEKFSFTLWFSICKSLEIVKRLTYLMLLKTSPSLVMRRNVFAVVAM